MNRATHLRCGVHMLDLAQPRVMGILNVTPDSFFDGGRYVDREQALDHARQMFADGADIVDIGGESTRPGAAPVPLEDELARVIPLVETLASEQRLVSVDTMKPAVMKAAISAGAAMINDVRALSEPGALDTVAASAVAICVMHMRGLPHNMQAAPTYVDVVEEVHGFLVQRAQACEAAGIAAARIAIDPGFGFGKTMAHNLALLRSLSSLAAAGYPVLVGLSRKSTIGTITGRDPLERIAGSIGAALAAVARGAAIVRVHDVRETVDALKVWHAFS